MTKKHFEAMAEHVRSMLMYADENSAEEQEAFAVRDAFIVVARQFNGRFDVERFECACKPRKENDND